MTFILDHKPDRKEEKAIEDEMNRLIAEDLPVTFEMSTTIISLKVSLLIDSLKVLQKCCDSFVSAILMSAFA